MSAFMGMGAGFILHREIDEKASARVFLAGAGVLLLLNCLVLFLHPAVPGFGPLEADLGGDLYFTAYDPARGAGGSALFAVWLSLIAAVFAAVSQRTAKLFRRYRPLDAYSLNIAGSIAGVVCFMLLSRLRAPAAVWFVLLAPVFAYSASRDPVPFRAAHAALLLLCAGAAALSDARPPSASVRWSPYQKVELVRPRGAPATILVNGVYHQLILDEAGLRGEGSEFPYARPHELRGRSGLKPFASVLVLGAGTGNDVAAALLAGADRIDAVEIDPVIASFGKSENPLRPFDDPRVRLHIGDGRAFLIRARRGYDLIVFALTDSLVKASPLSQLRLENYLFTQQAFRRAYELLNPGGDLVFYNYCRQPWLLDKITALLSRATGAEPRVLFKSEDFAMLEAEKDPSRPASAVSPAPRDLPTDDWPFLYLKSRGVPAFYLRGMAAVSACALGLLALLQVRSRRERALRRVGPSIPLAFLFMGIAFSLLESKTVIQFSLLFGTTWVNTSLVFVAVLALVLAANWTAERLRGRPIHLLYALLAAACLLPLAYPLSNLLEVRQAWERFFFASLLAFSPIYLANVLFGIGFKDLAAAEYVFGWNLIGAMLGVVAEYFSLATGYDALSVGVLSCYTAAYLLLLQGSQRKI